MFPLLNRISSVRIALCLVTLVYAFSASSAYATNDVELRELVDLLKNNRRAIKLENGNLTGDGARFLLDEARSSQFFMIGEDHGIADLPLFTAAIFHSLKADGYQYFATETGPLTARYLEKMAREADWEKEFANFNQLYPFGLPFYNWKEEAWMAESIVKGSRAKGPVLWGLDQEFVGSAAFHFKRLVELAPNAQAKLVATEYYAKTEKEFDEIVKNKNPGLAFMSSAKTEDFDRLDTAFERSGPEAKLILAQMRVSYEIYLKNSQRKGYDSNLQRSILMKKHFMEYYDRALKLGRTQPKVLFKFGANHVKRGRNYTNVYDIGNFISEFADIKNSRSFHLLVLPLGGAKNNYFPFVGNVADKQKKIDGTDGGGILDTRVFSDLKNGNEWFVVDLRPLRSQVHRGKPAQPPKGFADVVWGFDAILLMPEVKAATSFN